MRTEYPERYMVLGLKIAFYRKKAGYTQETFAELIDKSVNFVGQVEGTGTVRGVSLETLFKIAQVLKISPSKLLEEDRLKRGKPSFCFKRRKRASFYCDMIPTGSVGG